MRILITGVTGFVGGHLAEAVLARPDAEVHGLGRHAVWPQEWSHLAPKVALTALDLFASPDLASYMGDLRPNWIFHLAGYAHVGRSFQEPAEAWKNNLEATRRLYDAVTASGVKPRILHVSSGMVYGEVEGACSEREPLRPDSPYAASKAAADLAAYQYTRHPGLDIVRVRPFNHIGPRQSPQYAVPRFSSQIAAIERGEQPPIVETGDLSAYRDLTDVRDMVDAYIRLLDHGQPGEVFNAGSGSIIMMQDVLDRLLKMSHAQVEVRRRADALRPTEARATCANASLLRHRTGWTPRFSIDQTLKDILNYWRENALPPGPRAN